MLEPETRALLFDILRPPEDYTVDVALATTYTLDLLALLTAPVAFSLFDVEDPKELLNQNSLAMLESLRRYADRLTVFCQAGMVNLPTVQFPQLAYLENAVVQCRRPSPGASFHPKIWVIRFIGPEGSVRYRLACLTRNLTFDRCWDTTLLLEGALHPTRVERRNNPLAAFVEALPALAMAAVSPDVAARAQMVSAEIRRVAFELPEGFEDYAFHPLGTSRGASLFEDVPGRMLVISPFASDDGLRMVAKGRRGTILVTRPETLAQEGCRLAEVERFFILSNEVSPATAEIEELPASRGLHAKCYVVENGAKARVWTGSANATASGLTRNIEFLVELVGPKSKFGIDTLLRRGEGKPNLMDLLQEVDRDAPLAPPDESGVRSAINRIRDGLSAAPLRATIEPDGDGYRFTLCSLEPLRVDANTSVLCWPVTLGRGHGRSVVEGATAVEFGIISLESLSAFVAFEVTATVAEQTSTETFVLNLPLEGAPSDRRERLLRAVLTDRRRFLQYLLMLLADDGLELANAMTDAERGRGTSTGNVDGPSEVALLESLLRMLDRSPDRLDHIAKLIDDVRTHDAERNLMPPGFDAIWKPIWTVRQEQRRCES